MIVNDGQKLLIRRESRKEAIEIRSTVGQGIEGNDNYGTN